MISQSYHVVYILMPYGITAVLSFVEICAQALQF